VINGGASVVLSGPVTGTTVVSGTLVLSHGSASDNTVAVGGEQIVSGFGTLDVLGSAALAASTTILSGGLQVVDGVASATTVLNGGEMIVSSGGVTDGATIDSHA
jgi:fibronectin-binding autotransporter adhesin